MLEYIQIIQEKALTHIKNSFNREINPICALDMGLGKTRIACNIIKNMIEENENSKILVIIKASNYKDPWINELLLTQCIKKSSEKDVFENCVYLHGKERFKYTKEKTGLYMFKHNNIFITPYDTLRIDIDADRYNPQLRFNLILYDELQLLINTKKLTKKLFSVCKLSAQKKIALTGSPIQNMELELGLMYIFLNNPRKMNEYIALQNIIIDLKEKCESEEDIKGEISEILEKQESILIEGISNCKDNNAIYFFYNDNQFYKRSTEILSLPIDRTHYEMAYNYFGNNTRKFLQKKVMFLSSPSSIIRTNSKTGLNIYCTKEIAVENILKHMKYGEKVIIFSLFKGVLNSYYDLCQRIGYPAILITGKDKDIKLQDKLTQFKYSDKINVLLTTLQKSSEGFNFDYANHIIILEFWWNPQKIIQAMSRIDRITQKRDIFIYILSYNITIPIEDENEKEEQKGFMIKEERIFHSTMLNKITETNVLLKEIYDKNKSFFGDIPKFKNMPKIRQFKNINTFEDEFSDFLNHPHIAKQEYPPEYFHNIGININETIEDTSFKIDYHNQISNTLLNFPWRIFIIDINQYLISFYDHIMSRKIGNVIRKNIQKIFMHSLTFNPKYDNYFPFLFIDEYSFQVYIKGTSQKINTLFAIGKRQNGSFQILNPLYYSSLRKNSISKINEMFEFLHEIGITNISTFIIGDIFFNIDYKKLQQFYDKPKSISSLSDIYYKKYFDLKRSSCPTNENLINNIESLFTELSYNDALESLKLFSSQVINFERALYRDMQHSLRCIKHLYRYPLETRSIIGTTNIVYILHLIIQALIRNVNFCSLHEANKYIAIAAEEIIKNGDKLIPNWDFINKHVHTL